MSDFETESNTESPRLPVEIQIEAHGVETVPWQQAQKGGTREDRMVREVSVRRPPKISDYSPVVPHSVATQAEEAVAAIARLDSSQGEHLAALSLLLLGAESVASSKIEHVEASLEDFARATHGSRANSSATSMAASVKALNGLIHSVRFGDEIVLKPILEAHRVLMEDDPRELPYAGKLRSMQNWINGSDHSPLGAHYIPPPAETVRAYIDDLLQFASRDDVPALVQAAVVHAHFESIHPFTDGNGRIGRALINAILRRRGVTFNIVVPLATSLVARRDTYFDALAAYREGDAGPIVRAFIRATRISVREAERSAQRLAELPDEWNTMYAETWGRAPRAGSAARKILDALPALPFFTTEELEDSIGGSTSSVYEAVEKLAQADIIHPLTDRKRKQIWCAGASMNELDGLGARIASVSKEDPAWQELSRKLSENAARNYFDA